MFTSFRFYRDGVFPALVFLTFVLMMLFGIFGEARAAAPTACLPYRLTLVREAQYIYGINAPVGMLAAQIEQESACRANVTAWDGGEGIAQFMKNTAIQVAKSHPELGKPNPYDSTWAIRAMIRMNNDDYKKVKGRNECEKWGAALKGYNAGLGYVLWAQEQSSTPDLWFTDTENINVRQSQQNFTYSRMYPREILFTRQRNYTSWGHVVCLPYQPSGLVKY